MQATTTLPNEITRDLKSALAAAGHTEHADEVTDLLPDRGRYELLNALEAGALDVLLARWIGEVAEHLRCRAADAAHIRDLLTGAAR